MFKDVIKDNISTIFLGILISLLYVATAFQQIHMGGSDFIQHGIVAESMMHGGTIPPHFLYHLLLICIHKLFHLPFSFAAYTIIFLTVFLTYVIAYKAFEHNGKTSNKHLLALAAFFLLISHPFAFLFPIDHHIYFGYIASNVYHNPTIVVLKPIALLHFILLCRLLMGELNHWLLLRVITILAVLTALSIVAKPNYIIALLPALFIVLPLRYFFLGEKELTVLKVVALSILLPSLVVLFIQFAYFYVAHSNNSIGIGLFSVYQTSSALWTLFPKLLASLAFPISLILIMGRRLIRQLDFQLSVTAYLVALLYSYSLTDIVGGNSISAGNFWWSAQITQFLLLFVCMRSYLGELYTKARLPKLVYLPAVIAALQLIAGILWVMSNLNGNYAW